MDFGAETRAATYAAAKAQISWMKSRGSFHRYTHLAAELQVRLHCADSDAEILGLSSQQWVKSHFRC